MSESTFKLQLRIPRKVRVKQTQMDREHFSQWLWDELAGLLGVHEGTMLSAEAAEKGLETESWTLDAAEAPRERDWVEDQEWTESELFFGTQAEAATAAERLRELTDVEIGQVLEQEQQDWDAQWKASFLNAGNGVQVPPDWRILPPWVEPSTVLLPGERALKINPGAGFGTGTHETTQLCLQAISEVNLDRKISGRPVLDFGSGSGILAIGAALLGARVDAVEIDTLAIDNSLENAQINGVESLIQYSQTLALAPGPYSLVIANILRPVLIEFSKKLVERMAPESNLILSGLIESDVAEVKQTYSALLQGWQPEVRELNEWRALVWRR